LFNSISFINPTSNNFYSTFYGTHRGTLRELEIIYLLVFTSFQDFHKDIK